MSLAIIGYGAASVNAIIALRTQGYTGAIQVFSNTNTRPYSPVMTGYYAGGTKTYEECFPWTEEELAQLNVEVHENEAVELLDVEAKTVITAKDSYCFEKCLVASGATPRTAEFPAGGGAPHLVLRTLEDAEALKNVLTNPECDRVLVSGASMIALRAVDACLSRGVQVTLLARKEHILAKTALPETAAAFEHVLENAGVELRLEQVIEALEPAGETGELTRVSFSNGDVEDFSAIIIAQGVEPNLSFVPEAALERSVGLVVDDYMRTSNPDVYAAGDVAQTQLAPYASGKLSTRIAGLWKDACVQGACAGRTMAADLAGVTPPANARYTGAFPNNTIIVAGAVMFSAGSVRMNERRWADIEQLDSCIRAVVYEQDPQTGSTKMAGYNVFAPCAEPFENDAYEIASMLFLRMTGALV